MTPRMTNDQCPRVRVEGGLDREACLRSSAASLRSLVIGHWSFIGHWSLVIGHSLGHSRSGHSRSVHWRPKRAFTLIELILVMALLAIVMAVSAPALSNFMRGRTLDSEARRFVSLTRYGQSRAV